MKDNLVKYKSLIQDTIHYLSEDAESNLLYLTDKESCFFKNELKKVKKRSLCLYEEKKQFSQSPSFLSKTEAEPIKKKVPEKKSIEIKTEKTSSSHIKQKNSKKKKNIFEETEKAEEKLSSFFIFEKPSFSMINLEEVKSHIQATFSKVQCIEKIPSDEKAKELSNSWKLKKLTADITILSFNENNKERLFLENVMHAINIRLLKAKIISAIEIEKANKWNSFLSDKTIKLFIACDYSIWSLPNLVKYYREDAATKTHYLGNKKLFLLPDISIYFKEPMLKKSLWQSISKTINSLSDQKIK